MQPVVIARDERPLERLHCQLLVVGGGAAGLAAAVTAAGQGLSVILLERYGFCGGAAVAGLSGTVCGLYAARPGARGAPEKLVFGFVDTFIAAMRARGGLTDPLRYGDTYTLVHEPLAWRDCADALLADAGVRTIYHATVTGVLAEGEQLHGVRAYTKQGPLEVTADLLVDASGDADLAAMAGLTTFQGDGGKVQNPTMIFRLQGVDVARFLRAQGDDSIMGAAVSSAIEASDPSGRVLPRRKIFLFPTTRPNELLVNGTRVVGADGHELNPLNASDLTEAEIQGRRQVRAYEAFFRQHLAGCENAFVNDTGVQVGVRQSRQVEGVSKLMNSDVTSGRKNADGIARSPWPIELHSGEKPKLHWLYDDYYEIPYGCFVPQRGEGLLIAGRSLSAEHEAMASARVTAQCFSYGFAIGHAATICVRDRVRPRDLHGRDLRALLNRNGAQLG